LKPAPTICEEVLYNREKVINIQLKMMEEDLKLAQHLARLPSSSRDNSRHQSPQRRDGGGGADQSDAGSIADDSNIKTHASMVLEKIQGFR